MKKLILIAWFLFFDFSLKADELYIRTFGDSGSKPIIFLHGGPGYNCANFEVTTAAKLADKGFFVIVYDRRGEGRSTNNRAEFTFEQTFNDLNSIYEKFDLQSSVLIGHSFGGMIATLFAVKYKEKIESIVLVGAPISLQESFKTIIDSSREIYQSRSDSTNLNYLDMLEKMDKSSMSYASYCFMHAMQNGFYETDNPNDNAKQIYSKFKSDTILMKHSSKMTYKAPQEFSKNENYTVLDLKQILSGLVGEISIYGLYGKEDGLFTKEQVSELEKIIGEKNLKYLDDCSHNVFIDRQEKFIEMMQKWCDI